MRYGFTTGSCAAAAAKAAAYMLLTGREKKNIRIETPKGIPYEAELEEIRRGEREVHCGVRKDGGDDPDITTGSLICARVSCAACGTEEKGGANPECGAETAGEAADMRKAGKARIFIDGGIGVGRVTRPGLDQPVGNAAINRVPREMILKEVSEVCDMTDYDGPLYVEIYVPDGERLAERTFNPRLGIEGGISILGTTGIVEPMSRQALLDTIRAELRIRRAEGAKTVFVAPGNYGLEFMKRSYDYDLDKSVKCSNFIGETLDMAAELGFERLMLTGHIGKLVKVAGGIMNTHSREADCRMELLAAAAIRQGVEGAVLRRILDCVSTEEALGLLEGTGRRDAVLDGLLEKILYHLDRRVQGRLQIECVLYSNEFGELARSSRAAEWFALYGGS